MTLMREVKRVGPAAPAALNLNVVCQVGGDIFDPEFSGVRTGSYRKRDKHLMVQVGIQRQEARAEMSRAVEIVQSRLLEAIDAAEAWATKRGLAENLDYLRVIAEEAIGG